MSIAAVVLAAGASKRLGEPKQLVMLGDETLLERTVRVAREAGCSPVVVVVGAEYAQVLGNSVLGDAVPVINDQWQEGMASSIRLGVRILGIVARDVEGVLLMTCDQPAVTVKHLLRLMSEGGGEGFALRGKERGSCFFPFEIL